MPRFHTREGLALLVLILGGLLAFSCSDDSAPRSTVSIDSINGNESLDSDVYNNGDDREPGTDDDAIFEDQVAIVVRNRPHDSALAIKSNGPFGAVIFTRYEVRFTGDDTLPQVSGAMYLRAPSGSTVTGEITIVPLAYKSVAPLLGLRQGGEILLNAEVTLIGEEDDSHDEITVKAVLPVHCANWEDKQQ
jgi:hypothetical protein